MAPIFLFKNILTIFVFVHIIINYIQFNLLLLLLKSYAMIL